MRDYVLNFKFHIIATDKINHALIICKAIAKLVRNNFKENVVGIEFWVDDDSD